MKYLFLILRKQLFFILFVILELIAFILLANHNNYHRTNIINTSSAITASVFDGFSSIREYFSLKGTNQKLLEENASLRSAGTLQGYPDSLFTVDTTYVFIPAKVISNTSRNRNNFIMINKGLADGLEKEMGIITSKGVAGIIIELSNHYATAMSVLNKDTRISARLKKNGQMVNVVWDGKDYRKGIVEDIPTHIDPMPGDTVITSGYSFVFPENIMIGTIGEKIHAGGTLNRAELIFSSDFNNLDYVYACKNLASEEIDSLKTMPQNE
jgi:rod shape-determining protein MreC